MLVHSSKVWLLIIVRIFVVFNKISIFVATITFRRRQGVSTHFKIGSSL